MTNAHDPFPGDDRLPLMDEIDWECYEEFLEEEESARTAYQESIRTLQASQQALDALSVHTRLGAAVVLALTTVINCSSPRNGFASFIKDARRKRKMMLDGLPRCTKEIECFESELQFLEKSHHPSEVTALFLRMWKSTYGMTKEAAQNFRNVAQLQRKIYHKLSKIWCGERGEE
jgi:hypothetical protein